MRIKELKLAGLNLKKFISLKTKELVDTGKDGTAINALSGGVDSAVVTMLGHKALGDRLKTYFIDNGLMRENEPRQIVDIFKRSGHICFTFSRRSFSYCSFGSYDSW